MSWVIVTIRSWEEALCRVHNNSVSIYERRRYDEERSERQVKETKQKEKSREESGLAVWEIKVLL
jgi:hypothetical protein